MKIHPYLVFDGQCEEAVSFYKDILGGTISMMSRFSEAPPEMPFSEDLKDKIMHCTLEFAGGVLLASDGGGEPVIQGNNTYMSLNVPEEEEALTVFTALAKNGIIIMPFEDVFWGGKFGMLTDQFGIQWMVSSEHKPG